MAEGVSKGLDERLYIKKCMFWRAVRAISARPYLCPPLGELANSSSYAASSAAAASIPDWCAEKLDSRGFSAQGLTLVHMSGSPRAISVGYIGYFQLLVRSFPRGGTNGGQRSSNWKTRVNRRSDPPHKAQYGESTVYYSRIGHRHLCPPENCEEGSSARTGSG